MEFKDNLKRARINAGYSQTMLGKEIGMDNSAISRYEAGGNEPTARVIVKLAAALNISTDELLGVKKPDKVLEELNALRRFANEIIHINKKYKGELKKWQT